MLTAIFCTAGIFFVFILIAYSFLQVKVVNNYVYQCVLLGGTSFAFQFALLEHDMPVLLDWLTLFFANALPLNFLLLIILISNYEIGHGNRNYSLLFIAAMIVGFIQASISVTHNLKDNVEANDSLMHSIFITLVVIQLIASIYSIYITGRRLLESKNITSTSFHEHILPCIAVTIFVLFGSMYVNASALPSGPAIHFFSITFCFGCLYMVYLRLNRSWSDIGYLGLTEKSFAANTLTLEFILRSDKKQPRVMQTPHAEGVMEFVNTFIDAEYFRMANLTMKKLSSLMDIPEYKIRTFIIHELGYKNFNNFINFYRTEYIKVKLSDPNNINLPVKSFAYESGFDSPEVCCRVFKGVTGETPSSYRKANNPSYLN